MARAPRAPRRIPGVILPGEELENPIDEAVREDRVGIAGTLTEVLDSLRDFDQGSIKGILYRKPRNGLGKYEWIEEIVPPFDINAMHAEMKDRFNGGDFQLRIFAEGRIRKNIDFSIAPDTTRLTPKPEDKKDSSDMMFGMFQLMSTQAQASSDRQMQMMMAMQQQARESSDRSMQMMMAMMTGLMGNQGKPTDLIPLFAAMQENKGGGGMKEMVETMVALKTLVSPSEEKAGFDPEDMVGSLVKLAGPVAGAIGKGIGAMTNRGQGSQTPPQGYEPNPAEPLALPAGPQQPALPPPLEGPAGGPAASPLLNLIRPDILYFYQRGHDPAKAADSIYDVIEAALVQGVITEDQLNDLVSSYALSEDWLSDLAAQGIDLRGNRAWADKLISELVAIHTGAGELDLPGDDDSGGSPRGGNDHADHGEARAPRVQEYDGAESGG